MPAVRIAEASMPPNAHTPPRPHRAVRIAGIDPGSHRTGWAVLDSTAATLHYVDSGVIHAEGDLSARLRAIADGLEHVLAVNRPAVVAVESMFHHRYSQSAITLGHA